MEPVVQRGTADGLDGSCAPRRRAELAHVELDGETVLLDDAGTLYQLDAVATIVWRCLDGSATIDSLAVDLSDAFHEDVERVRSDVLALARQLRHLGLLQAW